MWVIDAPRAEGAKEQPEGGDASSWIWPFVGFVEEQAGDDASWEPFNVENALHRPPQRCWIDGAAAVGQPAEKLAGLQSFLRRASVCGETFLDKGHRFAVKRYPHAGAQENAESIEGDSAKFYAVENLHVDRLQRDADRPRTEDGEANLYGDPTHFTLVVGFAGCTGGTFFPHGRMLAGLQAPPDGVSQGAQEGILVQSRRGRALLWSNHRGSKDSSGKVMPLHSSLHQSVLLAAPQSEVTRRVCIFGWEQEGRKWERCGFHGPPPKVRKDLFKRNVRDELSGCEGGPRGHEVFRQSKTQAAQKEIQDDSKNLSFDEATKSSLANYGHQDDSQTFQLRSNTQDNGPYEWQFLTSGGTCKWFFTCSSRAMTVEDMIR